jgi:flagellar motility protein MotE (MotC chaperone)
MARKDKEDRRSRRARGEFRLPRGGHTEEIDLDGPDPFAKKKPKEGSEEDPVSSEDIEVMKAARILAEERRTRELKTGTGPLETSFSSSDEIERVPRGGAPTEQLYLPPGITDELEDSVVIEGVRRLLEDRREALHRKHTLGQPYFSSDFTEEPETLSVVKGLRRKSAFWGYVAGATTIMALFTVPLLYKLIDIRGLSKNSKARIAAEEEKANARIREELRARLRKEVNTGDFNGDGHEDVIIVYPNSHEVRLGQPGGRTMPAAEAYEAQRKDLQTKQELEEKELRRIQKEEREAQKERQYEEKEGLKTRQKEEGESIDAHVEGLRERYDLGHSPDSD